jgi:murein DD-endopeptidase MepM/ murein hydrolase activator NlpD
VLGRLGPAAFGLATVAAFGLGVLGYSLFAGGDADAPPPTERSADADERVLDPDPSSFARDALGSSLLSLYRSTADEVGLDWTVIAAADELQGRAGPAEHQERVLGIAYSLQSLGAPADYRAALESLGGSPGFARSALSLATRYADFRGGGTPAAAGRLVLPTRGPVIALYGQRFGLLHDGIDIDAATGDEIRAAGAGLVVRIGPSPIYGEYTCVLHRFEPPLRGRRELTTCYGNQSRYAVQVGDPVDAGEVIGYVGCTGPCLRPHVHFQVRDGAGGAAPAIDPAPYLVRTPDVVGSGRPLEVER